MFRLWLAVAIAACGTPPAKPKLPPVDPSKEAHREAIEAQLRPYLDGEVVTSVVVGIYDAGKREVYGFGTGPGGKPPTGATLYDLGSATKIYTSLLLAEAVQRREVDLDAPISTLLPPGVTVPTQDNVSISAKHLALHSSGLPRYPPSILARKPMPPDPFAGYTEDVLYHDLINTKLQSAPGTEISFSDFGVGVLGHALGRKIGGGFMVALQTRVLQPLGLTDTFVALPPGGSSRKALGTDDDLKQVPRWTWGALVAAGGLMSSANDSLTLLEAELDAAAGSRGVMRPQMRLTQEPQLDRVGDNEGLGWMIDPSGRLWYDGRTSGFRSYFGFDPKTKRAVVVLAATSTTLIDFIGPIMFEVLDGTAKPPITPPGVNTMGAYVGKYDFAGTVLDVKLDGKRLYLEGPGEPRHRMAPYGDRGFWIEDLQAAAKFARDADVIKGLVFQVGGKTLVAPRLADAPKPEAPKP